MLMCAEGHLRTDCTRRQSRADGWLTQKVETMASNLAERGKRLTHRNALRGGVNRFAPSSVESVVLGVMRSALGGREAKGPAVAAKLGPRLASSKSWQNRHVLLSSQLL